MVYIINRKIHGCLEIPGIYISGISAHPCIILYITIIIIIIIIITIKISLILRKLDSYPNRRDSVVFRGLG